MTPGKVYYAEAFSTEDAIGNYHRHRKMLFRCRNFQSGDMSVLPIKLLAAYEDSQPITGIPRDPDQCTLAMSFLDILRPAELDDLTICIAWHWLSPDLARMIRDGTLEEAA